MSRPALSCVPGAAEPSTVTLLMARNLVRYFEGAVDKAVDELLGSQPGRPMTEARWRLEAAHDRLVAARNRRDRIISEMQAERWLWLVPEADGG